MCGIAGWVHFGRDLRGREEQRIGEAMTKTMQLRGPDDEGLWGDGDVLLGHRRLAVIDPKHAVQPMVANTGNETTAVLTYSGEIYNYQELRAELQARGHSFYTNSDTEVVLEAYRAWGTGFAARLNGMYALAIWDPRKRQLVLVRDRMGVKPLYYHTSRGLGLVFGSEPKALLAHPQLEPVVKSDGLAELLTMVKTPGHGVFDGIREVEPGQIVTFGIDGLRAHHYWTLSARDHSDDHPDSVAAVRTLLEDIVNRQMVSDVPLSSLLSGGLDSSIVTALASECLPRSQRPLRTFSVDFPGYSANFVPSAMRPEDDSPFARALSEHAGTDHRAITVDTDQLIAAHRDRSVLRARDMPGLGDMDASLYLLFRGVRESSTVALSGEAADELFGGYRWLIRDDIVNTDDFPWSAIGYQAGRADLLDPGLREALRLDEYRRGAYTAALTEVPVCEQDDPTERRMREVSYLAITRYMKILLDRKDRTSMASGLEVRVPFCDHRLVEYVFNVPWRIKNADGRGKTLLRQAAEGLVPREILNRKKVPYPATIDHRYGDMLNQRLREIVDDPNSRTWDLIDRREVDALVNASVPAGTDENERAGVEFVVQLEDWLRDYGIQVSV